MVLLCVYLLIHNVLSISIQKEISQIGLMDTLETTRRQIRHIYLYQNCRIDPYCGKRGAASDPQVYG